MIQKPKDYYLNRNFWIKDKSGKKVAKTFSELTEYYKRKWLLFPPSMHTKKQISEDEFQKIKDASIYIIRINGVAIDNNKLNNYNSIDFVTYSYNEISKLTELPQKYHYNLITEDGFKVMLQINSIVNISKKIATPQEIEEYNKLAKKYNKQPKDNRVVKLTDLNRLEYIFNKMTHQQKENAEPFPNFPPPPPAPHSLQSKKEEIEAIKNYIQNERKKEQSQKVLKTNTNKNITLLEHWYIKLGGRKLYYPYEKGDLKKYFDKYGNEVNLDIVQEYKKKNATYKELKNSGKHYINKTEIDKKELDQLWSDLGGMYFRMSSTNKRKVKRPENLYHPYIKLTRSNGEVYYKKRSELTEEDNKSLPPLPPPAKKEN